MRKESSQSIATLTSPAQCTIVNNRNNMSDTQSVTSGSDASGVPGGGHPSGLVIEDVGLLPLGEIPAPKKLSVLNYTLAVLCEDNKVLLGEIRTRGNDDWTLAGRCVNVVGDQNGTRLMDMTLVANAHQSSGASVIFLGERKNKERFLSAHHIKHGRSLELTEEVSSYDKSNVLGKSVSHVASDPTASEPTVFAVSNLVRKLKLEDGGSTLRPTPARAQVPSDCLDGTLCLCVQPASAPSRPTSASPGARQVNVAIGLKTKSVKNKNAVEWYSSRKDDLSHLKSASLRLPEDMEPVALLSDARDSRGVFVLYVNRSSSTTSIYRVSSVSSKAGNRYTLTFIQCAVFILLD